MINISGKKQQLFRGPLRHHARFEFHFHHFQEHCECLRGITVIVHNQDFLTGKGLFEVRSHEIQIFLERVNEWQFVIVSPAKTFYEHFAQIDRSPRPEWLAHAHIGS